MKCINCNHCVFEHKNHKGVARCGLLPTPRTRGKEITWAMDLFGGPDGLTRIRESLSKKTTAPSFCPLIDRTSTNVQSITMLDYCKRFSVSQTELAARMGVSDGTISKCIHAKEDTTERTKELFFNATGFILIPNRPLTSQYQEEIVRLNLRVADLERKLNASTDALDIVAISLNSVCNSLEECIHLINSCLKEVK